MGMSPPRVLLYDLETGGVNALKADLGFILCFGYKWLGEKDTHCLTLEEYGGFKKFAFDDSGLLKAALKIMGEANLLVAHYGDKFDRRFLQGRCVINGLKPPPPTKQRDTCLLARRYFNFSSNRLGHLAKLLDLPQQKSANGWPFAWMRVMAGDMVALRGMAEYCKQDVRTLEEVYLRLRQYDQAHPRMVGGRSMCGVCNGRVQYRGVSYVGDYRYRRFQCNQCGRWGREMRRMSE